MFATGIFRSVLGVAATSILLGVMVQTASAGDVGRWAGLQVGINAGAGFFDSIRPELFANSVSPTNIGDATTLSRGTLGKLDDSFGFGGLSIGINGQRRWFVYGVEADLQVSGAHEKVSDIFSNPNGTYPISGQAVLDMDYFGTVRGRWGWAPRDNLLVYATGGFAFGKLNYRIDAKEIDSGAVFETHPDDTTRYGWVVGGGLEYALNSVVSFKAEYQYLDFGSVRGTAPFTEIGSQAALYEGWTNKVDATFHTVRVGLNFKLDPPATYAAMK
ncbi:MAG: outer membrane protein [Hyphomicrobiaceae bacterium]